jgi:hypothetical protein
VNRGLTVFLLVFIVCSDSAVTSLRPRQSGFNFGRHIFSLLPEVGLFDLRALCVCVPVSPLY